MRQRQVLVVLMAIVYICSSATQKSQTSFWLTGQVLDQLTHVQIPGSKVEIMKLSDSTIIDSTDATTKIVSGNESRLESTFTLKIPRIEGDYILRVSLNGYETYYEQLTLDHFYSRETHRDLGNIYLKKERNVNLDEVTVTASKVKFYNRGDTLVYNADAFQLSEGSMLDALIRQLPGTELTKDGRIFVNGKFVESLLLNGKDFLGNDNQLILNELPSYMVKHVKVYDKLGEDSQFLGRQMEGDKKFVMDVQLKRQYNVGWTTYAEVGYGSENRYMGRLFALRFSDNSRLAIYGNANNLNDKQKPGESDDWSPSDLVNGLTEQQMGGIDYLVEERNGHYKLNGNVQLSHAINMTKSNTNRTNFLTGGDTYERVIQSNRDRDFTVNTMHNFYFQWKYANLTIKPSLKYNHNNQNSDYSSLSLNRSLSDFDIGCIDSIYAPTLPTGILESTINRNMRNTLTRGNVLETSVSAQSVIKFKRSPDHITLYADFSYRSAANYQFGRNSVEYFADGQVISMDFRNQYFDNMPDRGYGLTGKVAYTYQFLSGPFITFSYKYERRYARNHSYLYRLDWLPNWGIGTTQEVGALPTSDLYEQVIDATNSYGSRQTDNRHTFEPFLVWSHNNWSGQVVLPLSVLTRTLHYRRGSMDTTITKRNILPNVYSTFVNWKSADNRYTFEIMYGLDTRVPDMNLFVDIKDTSDPLNIREGNAGLKPSYEHSITSSFTRIYPTKRLMWGSQLHLGVTQDAIAMGYTYDKATGCRIYRPDNVNGNWRGTLSLAFGGAVDKKKRINAKVLLAAEYQRYVDLIGINGQSANRSVVNNSGLTEMLQLNYLLGHSTIGIKSSGTWGNVTSDHDDFTALNVADFNYGLTAQLQLPWQLHLGTDLTMYSRRGYADERMNTNDLVWNARLSRSFLRGQLNVILDGFDILGRLSNITRRMNSQSITEVRTNVIPRYVLLHVTYRFHSAR